MSDLPADTDELIENFELFDEWDDRYRYLIELGRKLPDFPDAARDEAHKVRGCMSQVWFVQQDDPEGRLRFLGDSDAMIVKGLIALLHVLYDGKRPEEVEHVPIDNIFEQIGFSQHLSANRRNGFFSMVSRLRQFAGNRPA
ncbi:MAG: SufE family protein [Myxococcota bacterium]